MSDPGLVRGLTGRMLRDDGAVVYLNGTEVWRSNMPTNATILHDTRADGTVNDPEEDAFFTQTLDHSLLVSGTNVVAVEVHQVSSTSSDLSFDFELRGTAVRPTPARIESLVIGNDLRFTWPAGAVPLRLYATTNLTGPVLWTPVSAVVTQSNGFANVTVPRIQRLRFFTLQYP